MGNGRNKARNIKHLPRCASLSQLMRRIRRVHAHLHSLSNGVAVKQLLSYQRGVVLLIVGTLAIHLYYMVYYLASILSTSSLASFQVSTFFLAQSM